MENFNLPEACYSYVATENEVVILKRGETGYYKTGIYAKDADEGKFITREQNARMGITELQENCMQIGSMFGFHVPGANPANYDADGKFKGV